MAGLLLFEEDRSNPIIASLGSGATRAAAALADDEAAAGVPDHQQQRPHDAGHDLLAGGRADHRREKPVADQSAYTVIVAQLINLYEGPNLVLNANYEPTSVPVPKGVGPVNGKILLTQ